MNVFKIINVYLFLLSLVGFISIFLRSLFVHISQTLFQGFDSLFYRYDITHDYASLLRSKTLHWIALGNSRQRCRILNLLLDSLEVEIMTKLSYLRIWVLFLVVSIDLIKLISSDLLVRIVIPEEKESLFERWSRRILNLLIKPISIIGPTLMDISLAILIFNDLMVLFKHMGKLLGANHTILHMIKCDRTVCHRVDIKCLHIFLILNYRINMNCLN